MIEQKLSLAFIQAVAELYNYQIPAESALVQKTRPDFTGDYTLVVFPILKISKKSPDLTASEIGDLIVKIVPEAGSFNVIKGFLNISLSNEYWISFFETNRNLPDFGSSVSAEGSPVVVEYS